MQLLNNTTTKTKVKVSQSAYKYTNNQD